MNPFSALAGALDKKLTQEIQAKTTIAVDAALAEVPLLAALLKGEPITLTIQLKGPTINA